MVIWERGADLHMAQLMPLPLTVSCFSKIQIGFYRAGWVKKVFKYLQHLLLHLYTTFILQQTAVSLTVRHILHVLV